MTATLHTIGYEKRTIEEFLVLLRDSEIDVLIDVRETAWSHKPGFSKTAFSAALDGIGVEYVHAKFAGNPKRLRRTAKSHAECLSRYRSYLASDSQIVDEFDELVDDRVSRGLSVAIVCFERHPGDCHRSILAHAWAERGYRQVEHIAPDGCRRLVASA